MGVICLWTGWKNSSLTTGSSPPTFRMPRPTFPNARTFPAVPALTAIRALTVVEPISAVVVVEAVSAVVENFLAVRLRRAGAAASAETARRSASEAAGGARVRRAPFLDTLGEERPTSFVVFLGFVVP